MQDYTTQSGFLPHIKCDTMAAAVQLLVKQLAEDGGVTDPDGLVEEVLLRENEGSTAIGGGLVIPHARYQGVVKVQVAVATLAEPLDIPAGDGQPVDVVILLVGPKGDPRQMLRVLARLARLVKQPDFLASLRTAASNEALRTAFLQGAEAKL